MHRQTVQDHTYIAIEPPRQVRRRRKRRYVGGCLLMCAGLLALGWLAVQSRPGWFRPPLADDELVQRARRETLNFADFLGDRLAAGAPFEVALDEQMLNEWIAAAPRIWPELCERFPEPVRTLAVGFDADGPSIGAHLCHNGWQVILSAGADVRVDDASGLVLRLRRVRAGRIPIPRRAIDALLSSLGPDSGSRDLMRIIDPLREGGVSSEFPLVNEFVWPNGHRRFRFQFIRAEPHRLVLGIEPLPSHR